MKTETQLSATLCVITNFKNILKTCEHVSPTEIVLLQYAESNESFMHLSWIRTGQVVLRVLHMFLSWAWI